MDLIVVLRGVSFVFLIGEIPLTDSTSIYIKII